MKKVKIVTVVIAISIIGLIINSTGFAIPNVQSTSNDSNNQQASDDSNDVQTFDGDLLPQQSPSNERIIQFEETSSETITESGDLQNPSIQSQLNQSQLPSQKTYNYNNQKESQV